MYATSVARWNLIISEFTEKNTTVILTFWHHFDLEVGICHWRGYKHVQVRRGYGHTHFESFIKSTTKSMLRCCFYFYWKLNTFFMQVLKYMYLGDKAWPCCKDESAVAAECSGWDSSDHLFLLVEWMPSCLLSATLPECWKQHSMATLIHSTNGILISKAGRNRVTVQRHSTVLSRLRWGTRQVCFGVDPDRQARWHRARDNIHNYTKRKQSAKWLKRWKMGKHRGHIPQLWPWSWKVLPTLLYNTCLWWYTMIPSSATKSSAVQKITVLPGLQMLKKI